MSNIENAPPGIDYDMYMQWLEMLRQGQDGQLPRMPDPIGLPNDAVDDLGGWMTDISKGSNLGTDLDYLIQNNLLDYGAFDPITTYEVADAPGRRRLDQMMASGDPLQMFIARGFQSGQDANGVMTELQKKLAMGDADSDKLRDRLPPSLDPDTPGVPDMYAVRDTLQSIESSLFSDPQGEMIDGQFMTSTTDDSPAREALLKAGYLNMPGETYDPWMFAPEGVTPESEQAVYDNEAKANAALYGRPNPFAAFGGGEMSGGAIDAMTGALSALNRNSSEIAELEAMRRRLEGDSDLAAGGRPNQMPAYQTVSVPGMDYGNNGPWDGEQERINRNRPGWTYLDTGGQDINDGRMREWTEQPDQVGSGSRRGMFGLPAVPMLDSIGSLVGGGIDAVKGVGHAARAALGADVREPTLAESGGMSPQQRLGAKRIANSALGAQFAAKDRAAGKAQQDHISAMTSLNRSESGMRQREAMARAMMEMGFSPFEDERRRRNESIYGR